MSVAPPNGPLGKSPIERGSIAGYCPSGGHVSAAMPYRLTIDQVEAMVRTGILTENDRCELIRGELIKKMVLGDLHVAVVRRLNYLLTRASNDRYIVGVQDTVKLFDSLPEPDVTLLRQRDDFYSAQTASPNDVLLLIEVADSSLDFDRDVKLPLYAENGIAEYWIVNLIDGCVEAHQSPQANGTYAARQVVLRGQQLSPLAVPGLLLSVDSILGAQSAT